MRISKSALEELNTLTAIIVRDIVSSAKKLLQNQNQKTLSVRHVKAILMVHKIDLLEMALGTIDKKISNVDSYVGEKGVRLETKANLFLSVSLCKQYIYSNLFKGMRIGRNTDVALAALAEYILFELLDLASNAVRGSRSVTLTPRHLLMTIENNLEFSSAFARFGYDIRSGGNLPYIRKELIPKTGKQSKTSKKVETDGVKKPHRFRPGTVALRSIRRYQKGVEPLVSQAVIRRLILSSAEGARISKMAFTAIQIFAESETIRMMRDALRLAIHSKRTTVAGKDVSLASELKYRPLESIYPQPSFDKSEHDITPLRKADLERMSYRAGVKTRSADFYKASAEFMKTLVHTIVSSAIESMRVAERKTLQPADVQIALDTLKTTHGSI